MFLISKIVYIVNRLLLLSEGDRGGKAWVFCSWLRFNRIQHEISVQYKANQGNLPNAPFIIYLSSIRRLMKDFKKGCGHVLKFNLYLFSWLYFPQVAVMIRTNQTIWTKCYLKVAVLLFHLSCESTARFCLCECAFIINSHFVNIKFINSRLLLIKIWLYYQFTFLKMTSCKIALSALCSNQW